MDNKATYSYSSSDVELAKRIRKEFSDEKTDLEVLANLTKTAERKARIPALCCGILFALVFGTGMCLCLFNVNLAIGIIIGLVGIAGAAIVPPIYESLLKKQKALITSEVMRLSSKVIGSASDLY